MAPVANRVEFYKNLLDDVVNGSIDIACLGEEEENTVLEMYKNLLAKINKSYMASYVQNTLIHREMDHERIYEYRNAIKATHDLLFSKYSTSFYHRPGSQYSSIYFNPTNTTAEMNFTKKCFAQGRIRAEEYGFKFMLDNTNPESRLFFDYNRESIVNYLERIMNLADLPNDNGVKAHVSNNPVDFKNMKQEGLLNLVSFLFPDLEDEIKTFKCSVISGLNHHMSLTHDPQNSEPKHEYKNLIKLSFKIIKNNLSTNFSANLFFEDITKGITIKTEKAEKLKKFNAAIKFLADICNGGHVTFFSPAKITINRNTVKQYVEKCLQNVLTNQKNMKKVLTDLGTDNLTDTLIQFNVCYKSNSIYKFICDDDSDTMVSINGMELDNEDVESAKLEDLVYGQIRILRNLGINFTETETKLKSDSIYYKRSEIEENNELSQIHMGVNPSVSEEFGIPQPKNNSDDQFDDDD